MPPKKNLLLIALIFSLGVKAQEWNLKTCVEYAMTNNIQVRISDVQSRISDETYRQSKLSRYPIGDFSGSASLNSGLNQNPVTFNRVTETYISGGLQLRTSAEIFNFFSKQNSVLANQWESMAARATVDKIKYDIALSVANGYLQALLAKEQENIAFLQVGQTRAQLDNTRKLVDAGTLPELNASQLEAQLAQDSANLIGAKGNVAQSILNLKALMNLDPATPFEIATPPVDQIPVEAIGDLQPEFVYNLAIANQPLQKVNSFKLKAAEKFMEASKGSMLPSVTAFGSLASTVFNKAQELRGYTPINAPIGNVQVNNDTYLVYPLEPFNVAYFGTPSFFSQLSNNFRQSVGLALTVPIFSGGSLRTNYEKSKLSFSSIKLQQDQDNIKLKQDIYQAYNASVVAMEKFNAAARSVDANNKTYSFAQKRYDVGMLSTLELITSQNNLLRAKFEYTINHFDYVFKLKVLEYYKGLGLKL